MTERDRCVVHVTTTDISLELLLGPQLAAFAARRLRRRRRVGARARTSTRSRRGASGTCRCAHATRSIAPAEDARAAARAGRLFRRCRPAIVHTHNPKPGVYGRHRGACRARPVVVNTVHGLYAQPDDPLAKRAVVYGLERIAAACSHAELVQNPEDLDDAAPAAACRADKLDLLGNGIDLARFDRRSIRRDEARAAATRARAPTDDGRRRRRRRSAGWSREGLPRGVRAPRRADHVGLRFASPSSASTSRQGRRD